MDVRCERCSTEYEFDDALVSGRGTTVKCTNCGHKFKIRRRDGDFSEDFWNVQTGDGRTLVFTSLRELQRAIQTQLVERTDMLSRGGLPPKAIGHIPELAPFFDAREPRKSLPPAPVTTRDGGEGPRPSRTSRPPPPPGATAPALGPPRARTSTRPDFPPEPYVAEDARAGAHPDAAPTSGVPVVGAPAPRAMRHTLLGTGGGDAASAVEAHAGAPGDASTSHREPMLPNVYDAPAPAAAFDAPPPAEPVDEERAPGTERIPGAPAHDATPLAGSASFDAADARVRTAPPPPMARHAIDSDPGERFHAPPPRTFDVSSPLPPAVPVGRAADLDDEDVRRGRGSLPDAPSSLGRRRSVGGYVVAVLVLAGIAVFGAVYARDRGIFARRAPAPVATTDPRVVAFLASGEKALADGNLDAAKESFDKASALAEKDPRVLLDVARLAAARADVPWLRMRLLAPDAKDDQRVTKDNLAELGAAARKAAADAIAVAPDDAAALRAKIDALRIEGDRDGARALVARVASSASQPETAYVLAALDLAENEPLWSTLTERLRAAASAESGPGRARAALAYALARSGDAPGARAEVERLASMPRPHPLLPLLRAYAERAPAAATKTDAGAPDSGLVAADGKHPREDAGAAAADKDKKGKALPTDARVLVAQGEAARERGQYDRAQELYSAALEKNPSDTEALSGVAAISYARRDLNNARASYKRVLSINPSYVPALVGLGDVEWDSGDRASAMKTYKEIVDRFPEGTYPPRVKHRLDGGSSTPAPVDTGGGG